MREHVLVAEQALGHFLPAGAEVHHINEVKADNRPANLVICQDAAYHKRLHRHLRVLRAGGNPFTESICTACKQLKGLAEFSNKPSRRTVSGECVACRRRRGRSQCLHTRNQEQTPVIVETKETQWGIDLVGARTVKANPTDAELDAEIMSERAGEIF